MKNLNGWQRLWVVVLAFWAAPVLTIGWSVWPSGATVSRRDVYTRMSRASASRLTDYYDVFAAAAGATVPTPYLSTDPNAGAALTGHESAVTPSLPPTEVDIGGGETLTFSGGAARREIERICNEYVSERQNILVNSACDLLQECLLGGSCLRWASMV